METEQKKTDYGYLKVTTRKGVSEKGRSKVMIVMHGEDRAAYESVITDDVLNFCDCAVFTLRPDAEQELKSSHEQLSEHLQNIGGMRILIAVVTGRFLSEECFARSVEVPEAIRQNVAVLPIVAETGLIDSFNSDPVFCGMQFLDRTSTDATALGYDTKLQKYLNSLILTQNEVSDIRRHHSGHAFLSYRKKDRPDARKLMAIIHDIKQDLAIWYDEFLTPGRHFDEEIADTIRKSELFAMAMTPNMLEKPNYVEEHEYKTASESGREILPVTMKDLGDADVDEVYPGLGNCINAEDTGTIAERIDGMSGLFAGYSGDPETAEHKYYIALGYLNGIDAEPDGARAEKLLHEAAAIRGGYYSKEAYRRLVSMYLNGAGVKLNRQLAKETQYRLYEYCEQEYSNTAAYGDLADLINELMNLGGLYYDDGDGRAAAEIYEKEAELISYVILETDAGENKSFCTEVNELAVLSFTRLGVLYTEAHDREKAKELVEAGIAVEKQLAKTIYGDEGSVILRLLSDINLNEQTALSEAIRGNYRRSTELYLLNVEIDREIIRLASAEEKQEVITREALSRITGWYSRAANNAVMAGWLEEAQDYCNKSLDTFNELGGSIRLLGSADSQGELFWTYFHISEIGRLTGNYGMMSEAAGNAVTVLEEIIRQSSAEKWEKYLHSMRERVITEPQTEHGKRAKAWFAAAARDEDIPADDEDFPFADEDIPYSAEDSLETLLEDLEHAEFMLNCGFSGEAEEDYRYILEKLKSGGYNVDDETVRSQTAVIEEKLKGNQV